MQFKTVSMVKHPLKKVWTVMRDELPRLADQMEDIESIRVESSRHSGNVHRIINVWQASARLPQFVASHLDSNLLCWTDHAEWHEAERECRWSIQHLHFGDSFHSAGVTRFDPAMGGRGTRITFSGTFGLNKEKLPKMLGILEEPALKMVESMLIKLIPKTFQKITAVIETDLSASDTNRRA